MPANPSREQILDSTMHCLARWGLGKTTLDDIATQAGCSRATIYRLFPGGKEALFGALVEREVAMFFDRIGQRLDVATSLEELLAGGMKAALEQIWSHPALTFLIEHELATVVRQPITAGLTHLVDLASGFVRPYLEPHVPEAVTGVAAEWVVRLTLSFATAPPRPDELDRTIVRTVEHLLVPGFAVLGAASPHPNRPAARAAEPTGVLL